MLVLSRKTCQSIIIGENIEVKLLRIDGNQARIGINAPQDVPVNREEVHLREQAGKETNLNVG